MERFKRKLTLLDIPVFEIEGEAEIWPIAVKFFLENGILSSKQSFNVSNVPASGAAPEQRGDEDQDLEVFEALLGVEESGICFVERITFDCLAGGPHQIYSALLIHERDIVESIEVALLQINSGSSYYGKELEVIQPESLSKQSLVFILKN